MGAVRIEVLRAYPRYGRTWLPGSVILVPEHALAGVLGARPPFGRVLDDEQEVVALAATDGALALADDYGFDLRPFAGGGSGADGRIVKKDVQRWLLASEEN